MQPDNHAFARINVLGCRIAALDLASAVALIEGWVKSDKRGRYVCVTGVHGIMESLADERIRRIHNRADCCVPDGMPLTWIGRLRGHAGMDRVYGPDLLLELLRRSIPGGYTHFFCGGKPGVAELLKSRMEARYPGLRVRGTLSPPFGPLAPATEDAMIAQINAAGADILWIGLSTPKQEAQMAAFQARVNARVMIGVGAAFDFHSGRVRQAPRWMQRAGLEWVFRLVQEPRRLARRYVLGNPRFLAHLFCQATGLRKYPCDNGGGGA